MEPGVWINLGTTAVVLISLWKTTANTTQNIKESLTEFKSDIRKEIQTEKRHALELANQRIGCIEKDLDEIFPRLRGTEDNLKKNCFAITQVQQNCIKHKDYKLLGGTDADIQR